MFQFFPELLGAFLESVQFQTLHFLQKKHCIASTFVVEDFEPSSSQKLSIIVHNLHENGMNSKFEVKLRQIFIEKCFYLFNKNTGQRMQLLLINFKNLFHENLIIFQNLL